MANHASALKRIRQTERRTERNIMWRSRLRSHVRKVEDALKAGDAVAAVSALAEAMPMLHRSAQQGIIHRNTAARKISRLTHRVAALSKAA